MKYQIYPHIRTPTDLGIACIGNPQTAIVPSAYRIDRAEYGRRLAELEGGVFTKRGYSVPQKPNNKRVKDKKRGGITFERQ